MRYLLDDIHGNIHCKIWVFHQISARPLAWHSKFWPVSGYRRRCICYSYDLMQDSSNSIADALELLQSCTKPSIPTQVCWHEWVGTTEIVTWCHQMEPFSMLLALCKGNPPITAGFPSQRPGTWSFNVRLNKRLDTVEMPMIWDTIALLVTPDHCNEVLGFSLLPWHIP